MMMRTIVIMMMITMMVLMMMMINSRLYATDWRRPRTGGYIQFDLENE